MEHRCRHLFPSNPLDIPCNFQSYLYECCLCIYHACMCDIQPVLSIRCICQCHSLNRHPAMVSVGIALAYMCDTFDLHLFENICQVGNFCTFFVQSCLGIYQWNTLCTLFGILPMKCIRWDILCMVYQRFCTGLLDTNHCRMPLSSVHNILRQW